MALALASVLAQDGGVYQYDRAALLLPSGALVYVDAGIALDGPVALARAQELERARATPKAETPQWVTTAAAVVAAGVYAADQVRRWVHP
jgi:hypothetical protein